MKLKKNDKAVTSQTPDGSEFVPLSADKLAGTAVAKKNISAKMLIAAIFTLALIGLAGYVIVSKNNSEKIKPSRPNQAQSSAQKAYAKANELSLSGKTAEAQKTLDQQLALEKDAKGQGRIYELKASVAFSSGDTKVGLDYATKAESLAPTRNSALLIANMADVLEDKPLAIKYYKIVITRTDSKIDDYTIPGLEKQIKILEGSNG